MSDPTLGICGRSVAHLAPFVFACPCAPIGRDLHIGAAFSNHCYTCAFDAAVHDAADIAIYEQNRVGRVFDVVRYELSKRLPGIVAGLPGRKVNQTAAQRNYVYATTVALPTEAAEAATYQVFFSLRRATKGLGYDLSLTVESAYPIEGPPQVAKRPSSIRFLVLATKVFQGRRVTFSPR